MWGQGTQNHRPCVHWLNMLIMPKKGQPRNSETTAYQNIHARVYTLFAQAGISSHVAARYVKEKTITPAIKADIMSELRESLLNELADMYDAEQQLLKALPKLEEAAAAPELKETLESHGRETEEHVERLKETFSVLGATPKAKKCQAMQGLIAEAEQQISDHGGDAALVCLAQKIEHYEIAAYGTLRSWASLLEEDQAADLLADILDQEKMTDERLTEIAESTINIEAAEEEASQGEEAEQEEVEAPRRTRRRS